VNVANLKDQFLELLPPPLPNDWEIEEYLEGLAAGASEPRQAVILQQVASIWPVSNSLCYSYLSCAPDALTCLQDEQLPDWVAAILDIYEKKGLKEAQSFMADVEGNYLCLLRGETGIELSEVSGRLQPYAQAIAGKPLLLNASSEIYTDSAGIFLPRKTARFTNEADNFLYYKLLVTFQLGFLTCRSHDLILTGDSRLANDLREECEASPLPGAIGLEDFWQLFPEPRLAENLYTLIEGLRIAAHLAENFTGLWRDSEPLRHQLAMLPPTDNLSVKTAAVTTLYRLLLTGEPDDMSERHEELASLILACFREPGDRPADSAARTAAIYGLLKSCRDIYTPPDFPEFPGRLHPARYRLVRLEERRQAKEKFIKGLATVLLEKADTALDDNGDNADDQSGGDGASSDSPAALLIKPAAKGSPSDGDREDGPERFLTLDNLRIEIPEALQSLADEITGDLGHIPNDYISAAQGVAGRGSPPPDLASADDEGESLSASLTYHEWDYRRKGFRKDWCLLNEKEVAPVKGNFVEKTLARYRGMLALLRKQFEMLRCQERFVRRRRDGDDIDFDALVESLADIRAGHPGSEKLFVRLQRDDRNIAVMFLIDMSSSTEGWVNRALKEALILTGEALQVLGDRYAICGFSGMRRTRSDFYRIKDFDEPYSDTIKGRIAAIAPQEYTRMGPPLRHAARLLQEVDAKVRLLIVLSDGKPEDYDDYKGKYAIEDTRHALIEAKTAGIHPFCITIDRQAHDYMAHMYGEVNYIFLDKVRDLPRRMPDIYRGLTS